MEPAPKLVTLRTLIAAVVAASVLSIALAVGISAAMLAGAEPGPPGVQGEQGLRGEVGPAGPQGAPGDPAQAEVDEEEVWGAIEGDPGRLGQALDPAPDDLQSEVEQVQSDLSSLCSDLSLTDALSSEVFSCP